MNTPTPKHPPPIPPTFSSGFGYFHNCWWKSAWRRLDRVGLEWCGELMDLAYGGENGERLVKDIFGGKASLASSDQGKPVVPHRAVSTPRAWILSSTPPVFLKDLPGRSDTLCPDHSRIPKSSTTINHIRPQHQYPYSTPFTCLDLVAGFEVWATSLYNIVRYMLRHPAEAAAFRHVLLDWSFRRFLGLLGGCLRALGIIVPLMVVVSIYLLLWYIGWWYSSRLWGRRCYLYV